MKKILIPFMVLVMFAVGTPQVNAQVQNSCGYLLKDYLSYGVENDEAQVRLLQAFLQGIEKLPVEVTGEFDNQTLNGVKLFQAKYQEEVLSPWGTSVPTGDVYITTKNKIDEIFCGKEIPLTENQLDIVTANNSVVLGDFIDRNTEPSPVLSLVTDNGTVDDEAMEEEIDEDHDDSIGSFIMLPNSPKETVFYSLWLILIMALVYILGSLFAGFRDSEGLSLNDLRMRKLIYFIVGTIVGLIFVTIFELNVLIVPLIVIVVIFAILLLYYFRKNS